MLTFKLSSISTASVDNWKYLTLVVTIILGTVFWIYLPTLGAISTEICRSTYRPICRSKCRRSVGQYIDRLSAFITHPLFSRDLIGYFTSRFGQLSRNNPRLIWYLSSSSDFHWKKQSLQAKGRHKSFNFHINYYTWKKNDLFCRV